MTTNQLKLSTQRALLGAITENTRAITVGYKENNLLLRAVYYRNPTEYEKELISVSHTEIIADFNEIHHAEEEHIINSEEKLDEHLLDFWAYMRN